MIVVVVELVHINHLFSSELQLYVSVGKGICFLYVYEVKLDYYLILNNNICIIIIYTN